MQHFAAPSDHDNNELAGLAELYCAEIGRLHSFVARRLGDDDAQDVVSEVFHAAAIAFREGNGHTITAAWLTTVAKNKVINRWRRAETRKAKAHLLSTPNHEVPVDWKYDDRREFVLSALDALKPRHRALLILHHVDGMPLREIAEAADQSYEAIESALVRARAAFRRVYEGIGK